MHVQPRPRRDKSWDATIYWFIPVEMKRQDRCISYWLVCRIKIFKMPEYGNSYSHTPIKIIQSFCVLSPFFLIIALDWHGNVQKHLLCLLLLTSRYVSIRTTTNHNPSMKQFSALYNLFWRFYAISSVFIFPYRTNLCTWVYDSSNISIVYLITLIFNSIPIRYAT